MRWIKANKIVKVMTFVKFFASLLAFNTKIFQSKKNKPGINNQN